MKFSGIIYLDNDIIIEIHKLQLEEHGGLAGIRDPGGLESAIAQPKASFGEDDLHPTIFDKAAAYAFYIAEAQAFVDGNKRTALTAALTFLAINGYEFTEDQSVFYEAMISVAEKKVNKEELSDIFREAWIKFSFPKK